MHEQEPIDLASLDPMQDAAHWRGIVDATLLRVDEVLAERWKDPFTLIASWRRPLIVAACIALALLVPVEFVLEKRESMIEQVQLLARLSARSALGEGPPTGAELSRALAPDALP